LRNIDRSNAIEALVRRHADKLLTFNARIVACNVVIEAPHRQKLHGGHYRVRLDLVVPGAELVADTTPDQGCAHEDVFAAIDRAFERAARLLRDHVAMRVGRAQATHERSG
jgi:ribosome-associated translation inhibitor RaiA